MKKQIDTYLEELIKEEGILYDAMRYSLLAGGKRLRPQLAMMAAEAFGASPRDALPYGAALECVHTYSLIHDDLPCMDDDDLRRGKPTCHKKFGEAIALLAGDGLLTLAFSIISNAPLSVLQNTKATAILASHAGAYGMVQGQVLDMTLNKNDIEKTKEMQRLKTGGLIRAACALGAIAAGKDENLLDDFACNLGAAFQIQDDILDVTGTEAELGKPIHSDAKNKKNTIVSIVGVQKATEMMHGFSKNAIEALSFLGEKGADLRHLTESLIERTM